VLFAHGITGRATDLSTLGYVPLGIEHMLLGWDHLLFVLGIVLLAGQPQRAAKLISLFVLGHSLTLIAGTLLEWRLSPVFVDGVIALSVVYVAVLGLRGRPEDWTAVAATVFGFGLVHGLGLSTRLQELGIPDDGLLGKTLAFNVGLEIGQLLAVLVMVAVIRAVAPRVRGWAAVKRGLFGAMAVAGTLGAALLVM
jgi:hydrogenase/urease accessory protein HupE